MTHADLATQVAAATTYEDCFVPALFDEWAPRLVAAAHILEGQRVLDVACGTGILTRGVAAAVAPGGTVIGLDPDPGMLAVAQRRAPARTWCQGVAETLPFPDRSFDAVVSQFGLMFFRDRVRALGELWRVLRPEGRLAVAVWASLADTPAYAAEVALVERLGGVAAADVLRSPFGLGNADQLPPLFVQAGILSHKITTIVGTARFPSIRATVEPDLRGWLPLVGVCLPGPIIDQILAEAEHVLEPYLTPEGTVQFESPAHIVTATRPC